MSSRPEAGVDFFACGALPVPRVTIQDAERIAESFFLGRTVRAQPLGSQQDSNFLLAEPAGAVAGVLKIAKRTQTAVRDRPRRRGPKSTAQTWNSAPSIRSRMRRDRLAR